MIEHFKTHPTLPNGAKIPLSTAVRADNLLFVSGQLGVDENWQPIAGGIGPQTTACLNRIAAILDQNGLGPEKIVKVTAWLEHKEDFQDFNTAYSCFFGENPLPARSTIVSQLLLSGCMVEIEAVALAT